MPRTKSKIPLKDSITALEHDAGDFARSINKLRNYAYEINNCAQELEAKLSIFCTFVDNLKKLKE